MRLPISKIAASTTLVSETDNLYALKQSGAWLLILQFAWLLYPPAHAQGDTGPPGMDGLVEMFVVVAILPFLAIGLSFLIFKATGKAWVFFLAPFFMAGLSVIGLAELTSKSVPSPTEFIQFGAWVYGAHMLAVAIVYPIFRRTKKRWLFFLAPIVGWVIQFISLMFIYS